MTEFAVPRCDQRLVETARSLYRLSCVRSELLGDALLSETAWNMLLDLVISESEGRRLSVSALCLGSRSAAATANRYIGLLEEDGLIVRTRDRHDNRRCFIELTARGRSVMGTLLGEGGAMQSPIGDDDP